MLFFVQSFHFQVFLLIFFVFFGLFQIMFYGHHVGDMEVALSQKDRKFRKSVHMFFCFSIFKAIWCSRNLEHLYLILTKAVLWPPCWRYRGGSFTQKGSFSIFRHIYIIMVNILGWDICTLEPLAVHPTNQGWLGYTIDTQLTTQQTRVGWGMQKEPG